MLKLETSYYGGNSPKVFGETWQLMNDSIIAHQQREVIQQLVKHLRTIDSNALSARDNPMTPWLHAECAEALAAVQPFLD